VTSPWDVVWALVCVLIGLSAAGIAISAATYSGMFTRRGALAYGAVAGIIVAAIAAYLVFAL
jgi:hypothetical protein